MPEEKTSDFCTCFPVCPDFFRFALLFLSGSGFWRAQNIFLLI